MEEDWGHFGRKKNWAMRFFQNSCFFSQNILFWEKSSRDPVWIIWPLLLFLLLHRQEERKAFKRKLPFYGLYMVYILYICVTVKLKITYYDIWQIRPFILLAVSICLHMKLCCISLCFCIVYCFNTQCSIGFWDWINRK